MTIEEVIEHVCQTTALIYHSIGDYSEPSDGFCRKCQQNKMTYFNYQHSGKTLRYMRDAVVEKLQRDGYMIARGFDKKTGDEIQVAKQDARKGRRIEK